VAQLCPYDGELKRLGLKVLLVTFSSKGFAHKFREEVCSSFPVLINRERDLYRTYGLESSLLRSWGWKNLWTYAKRLLSGQEWKGIQGDSTQLGGDFIIDRDGIVQLAYRSRDPTDRLPVEELMEHLQEISRRHKDPDSE